MTTNKLLRIKDFVTTSYSTSWKESKKQGFVKRALLLTSFRFSEALYKLCEPSKRSLPCKTKLVQKKVLRVCKSPSKPREKVKIGNVLASQEHAYKDRTKLLKVQLQNSDKSLVCQGFVTALLTKQSFVQDLSEVRVFYQRMSTHLPQEAYSCKRNAVLTDVFWYPSHTTSYTIVRPLVACLRSTITLACISTLLPVYPDLSNLKIGYSRNRIRKQIVPTIKFFLNPKAEKALFQFSEFYNKEIFSIDHLKEI